MLAAAGVVLQRREQVLEQVELAVAVLELLPEPMERLTLVVALVATLEITLIQAAQAVQALSLFATPAQFNISLVAQ